MWVYESFYDQRLLLDLDSRQIVGTNGEWIIAEETLAPQDRLYVIHVKTPRFIWVRFNSGRGGGWAGESVIEWMEEPLEYAATKFWTSEAAEAINTYHRKRAAVESLMDYAQRRRER